MPPAASPAGGAGDRRPTPSGPGPPGPDVWQLLWPQAAWRGRGGPIPCSACAIAWSGWRCGNAGPTAALLLQELVLSGWAPPTELRPV